MTDLYYKDGTVTLTAGSATVAGSGTAWTMFGVVGGILVADGLTEAIPIAAAPNDTELTLEWSAPANLNGVEYAIYLVTAEQSRAIWANRQLSQMLARAVGVNLARSAFGSVIGDRDQYDAEDAGFAFVLVEEPNDPVLYLKLSDTDGDWSSAKPWRGPSGQASWTPIHAIVTDGDRRVEQLIDYFGGAGAKPTDYINQYRSGSGYTSVIANATDVRGIPGDIDSVTPFYTTRIQTDTTPAEARSGLKAAYDPTAPAGIPASLSLIMEENGILDEWFTRASSGTYFDALGVMRTAATNEPRFDHEPVTGELSGLLIEGARTNLVTYSEQFDNAAWTKTNASVTANAVAAPDGASTADKIVENTANDIHFLLHNGTISADTVYCQSTFINAAERNKGVLQYVAAGGVTGISLAFDLVAKTATPVPFGSATLTAFGIEEVGDGWFRLWVAGKVDAVSTSAGMTLILLDATGSSTYTGDGTSGLYCWGAQLEVGAFPSSYIKTEGSTATRAADAPLIGTDDFLFNGSEGTIFVKFRTAKGKPIASEIVQTILHLDDGSFDNRFSIHRTDADIIEVSRGIAAAYTNLPVLAASDDGAEYAVAFSWSGSSFSGIATGGTLQSGSGGAPSGLTTLRIGRTPGGNEVNSPVTHLIVYPRALSAAALETMVAA